MEKTSRQMTDDLITELSQDSRNALVIATLLSAQRSHDDTRQIIRGMHGPSLFAQIVVTILGVISAFVICSMIP